MAPKDKIDPNADKINQMGTFINLSSQCFKPWLWIPFAMILLFALKFRTGFCPHAEKFCALLHMINIIYWKIQ